MGNSRSRTNRILRRAAADARGDAGGAGGRGGGARAGGGGGVAAGEGRDMERLAELLILRQELEQRQQELRTSLERRGGTERGGAEGEGAGGGGTGGGGGGGGSETRSFLRRFLQHHLIMEYLERNMNLDDSDDNNNGSDSEDNLAPDSDSASTTTYEGVEQLFVEEEEWSEESERARCEREIMDAAKRIRAFKLSVLGLFEEQKDELQKRISNAIEVQTTLEDLLRGQQEAHEKGDLDRLVSIKDLVRDIHADKDFVDPAGIGSLGRKLDDILSGVAVLRELTSIRSEDEVLCSVCLSCPSPGVIWDCVRCDHLVCDSCRRRVTACPTCRVRFRAKSGTAPRRNRWAEKLARMQREKVALNEQE